MTFLALLFAALLVALSISRRTIRRQRRTITALKWENNGLLEALSARKKFGGLIVPIREFRS